MPSTGEPVENEKNTDSLVRGSGKRALKKHLEPGGWRGMRGQQEDRQEPVPCEDLVGEERDCGRRQKSKRQGWCLGRMLQATWSSFWGQQVATEFWAQGCQKQGKGPKDTRKKSLWMKRSWESRSFQNLSWI